MGERRDGEWPNGRRNGGRHRQGEAVAAAAASPRQSRCRCLGEDYRDWGWDWWPPSRSSSFVVTHNRRCHCRARKRERERRACEIGERLRGSYGYITGAQETDGPKPSGRISQPSKNLASANFNPFSSYLRLNTAISGKLCLAAKLEYPSGGSSYPL